MTGLSFTLYSRDPPALSGEPAAEPSTAPVLTAEAANENLGRIAMDNDSDNVGGYAVPVDPMDLLQCDSCQ